MGLLQRIHRGENAIDFPRLWRPALIISGLLMLVSIASLVFRGVDRSIEFEGGSLWEVNAPGVSVADARDFLRPLGEGSAKIQLVDGQTLRIQSELKDPAKAEEIRTQLGQLGTVDAVQSVGPTWGEQLRNKAIRALVVFFVLLAAYISLRLEWRMAVGALVSVVHDVVISVGVYSLFGLVVSPATVVSFLTILGYSLYDTIVVYDKAHELSARPAVANKYTYTDMMNLSLNQVLTRSIATTLAAVIPVASMLIYGSIALGASTLQEFAVALMVGLAAGAYSSVFIAAPIVAWLKEREPRHRAVRERLASRGVIGEGTTILDAREVGGAAPGATASAPPAKATRSSAATAVADPPAQRPAPSGTAIPPRPRKKKRR